MFDVLTESEMEFYKHYVKPFLLFFSEEDFTIEVNPFAAEKMCNDYFDFLECGLQGDIDYEVGERVRDRLSFEEINFYEECLETMSIHSPMFDVISQVIDEIHEEVRVESENNFHFALRIFLKQHRFFYTDDGVPKNKPFEGVW